MHITYENRQLIHEISLHDDVFSGFKYDYENRCIFVRLVDGAGWHSAERTITFSNTIWFNMQACDFWGCGNAIMYLANNPEPSAFVELRKEKQKTSEYANSILNKDIPFLSLEILFNSGGILQIICESIDINM